MLRIRRERGKREGELVARVYTVSQKLGWGGGVSDCYTIMSIYRRLHLHYISISVIIGTLIEHIRRWMIQ